MEQRKPSRGEGGEEELDDSRISMPALARPCTSAVHTSTYGANLPLWMCINDQYLSPYQTRAKWLPWLLRKSRPFIFIYRPLGPIYFNIWGIFTIVGVWMIITYHHTKPEPIGCLGCWEKAGPLYFNIGPWDPHTSNYGAYLPLWVWGWSLPITIPNQSHVAALVAKKKQALCIEI